MHEINGSRSTPGTAPLTSQLALLNSTTTTKSRSDQTRSGFG